MNVNSYSVAIAPAKSQENTFVGRFAKCVADQGYRVEDFTWSRLRGVKVVIFHWPSGFFIASDWKKIAKCLIQIATIQTYRKLFGLRFVWVVHNIRPHDRVASPHWLVNSFISVLDGIIVLSDYSVSLLKETYQVPNSLAVLKTVHGHYVQDMEIPWQAQLPYIDAINMLFFGQIRHYKGVEELVSAFSSYAEQELTLTVAGFAPDDVLLEDITKVALTSDKIFLDIRDSHLPEIDLERHLDAAHVVILPYRDILNSGSALFALSRNRPVIAPRIGSLPELQKAVGDNWVYLYEGSLTERVMLDCANWLRERDTQASCDLSEFDWDRVGADLGKYLQRLTK